MIKNKVPFIGEFQRENSKEKIKIESIAGKPELYTIKDDWDGTQYKVELKSYIRASSENLYVIIGKDGIGRSFINTKSPNQFDMNGINFYRISEEDF